MRTGEELFSEYMTEYICMFVQANFILVFDTASQQIKPHVNPTPTPLPAKCFLNGVNLFVHQSKRQKNALLSVREVGLLTGLFKLNFIF